MATHHQVQLWERLRYHTVVYSFTAQMNENLFLTLIHAKRDESFNAPFDVMKTQGDHAYIVLFGEELQDVKKHFFEWVRETLEFQVKRGDSGNPVLTEPEESHRINNPGAAGKGAKRRRVTTTITQVPKMAPLS